ncbi:hypothetical protein BWQ96_08236 [Gracilariopsis chorda]|uniref:Uncharacterized protein n=1 Tax=Gracilariopsis chorda TaxID=448386 RepID=A0A2V3IJ01_9FLOR|nr:hypothetical protein BWQ96_08236 [Gracilariopsis chorda]|eukprot:PXF42028.1 hypothetical protein BWQ96_08236 [Gracilariopsis chorda]
MDTEQRGPGGGWDFKSDFSGYEGSGYLSYKPWSNYGGTEAKPESMLDTRIKTYFFTVNTTGKYRIVLKSAAPHPTEHNDLWMAVPESGAIMRRFGRDVDLTWPASRNERGELMLDGQNWFKVYQNQGGNTWNYGGKTVDHNGHVIITRELKADHSWYSVRIAGRSTQFAVDRIILYLCDGAQCDDWSEEFKTATVRATESHTPQNSCGM